MSALRPIQEFVRPVRGRLAAAVCFLLLGTVLQLVFPFFVGMLVDSTLEARAGIGANLPAWARDIDRVGFVLLGIVVAILVCVYLDTAWLMQSAEVILRNMRERVFSHLVRQPMAFFARSRIADLSSRVQADLALLQEFLLNDARLGLRYGALMLGGLVLMIVTSPMLSITLGVIGPPVIALAVWFGRSISSVSREAQQRLGESNIITDECLQAITSVKAFANESHEIERYQASQSRYFGTALSSCRKRARFTALILFAVFSGTVFVMWFGSRQIEVGSLTPGEFTRFMFYLAFTGSSLGTLADVYGRMKRASGAFERTCEILASEPEHREPTNPSPATLSGSVQVENLTFCYPGAPDMPVLNDISLDILQGETVAFAGPSGAGKSTLVSLLLRFFEPNSGSIAFDGRASSEFGLRELRRQIAFVPQEIILFGTSLMDNIRYGNPDATDQDVIAAAKRAHIDNFINDLPDGYATLAGDRGARLSGGQRQRIAIARAILRDPRILILDEATSALDGPNEESVLRSLKEAFADRTCIVIAHRLSTLRQADRVVVLRTGEIENQGTHEELLGRDSFYRDLCERVEGRNWQQ
jgi:ABC-type multidrug transport system fused ATPase/permease subunit